MTRLRSTWLAALAGIALLWTGAAPAEAPSAWLGSWAASQQVPEERNALPDADLTDATLRQVVRLSTGGRSVRVLLSNAFGTEPLVIDAAHVALGTAGSARIGRGQALTFDGAPHVTIPAGAAYWSDPVAIDTPPLSSLAVSIHLPAAPARQTSHPGSRATSYLVHGNHVADPDLPGAKTVNHWYHLAVIDVDGSGRAIVTLGDSITDGHGVRDNRDERWSDRLAERLQADPRTRTVSVLNHGIGGNRLLLDGLGPNALARFDRDVLAMSGVRYLIVLEGVNDLGTLTRDAPASPEAHADLVRRLIGAYRQIVARARSHGIKAIGATITPYGGSDYYHPDAANEADRQAINAWIRAPGNFDAVIDFDAVLRDPRDPTRMLPAYDSGDHLHPGPAGYKAMADVIPLSLFR